MTVDEAIRKYAAATAEFKPRQFRVFINFEQLTAITRWPAVEIRVRPTTQKENNRSGTT